MKNINKMLQIRNYVSNAVDNEKKFKEEKGTSFIEVCRDYSERFLEEFNKNKKQLTPEQISKSPYPYKLCSFCGQAGCNWLYKGFPYHKKCFRYIMYKSAINTPRIMKDTIIRKKEDK